MKRKQTFRKDNCPYWGQAVITFNIFSAFIQGVIFVALLSLHPAFAESLEEKDVVTLQLRWHHQFQFAGYYAALEKGFYKDEGLNVRIQQGDQNNRPVDNVLSGVAQYAEGNSEVLYQRLKGKPLVALAAIFQHSPSVLLTLKSSGIRSVHDLIGKSVMLANNHEDADFLTMMLNEGISPSQINILPSSYNFNDLITGKVDAFNSYMTNEPYLLKKRNIEYNVIDPINYSVDFYSDIFFTSDLELRDHPERVEAMRRATLRGWRYAMDYPEEIIEIIKTKYLVKKSREHLRFEADEMRKLIIPDLIQIGHMNPERWQHMANIFIKSGLVSDDENLEGFIYDTTPSYLPGWVFPTLFSAFVFIILATSIIYYLHRFNRRLSLTKSTLLHSEERFRAISEATYGGIIIHDNGLILECNKGLSEITGYSYSELIGLNWLDFVVPEHIDRVVENIDIGYTHSYEILWVRRNGAKCPISIKGKDIIYKGRKARVIECIDITIRKKNEEQLKLAASVFTHAREGIMITDTEGNLIDVNDTFTHITGYSREEVLGKNPNILKSGRHGNEFYVDMWNSLLESKVWSGELWNKRKNGEIFPELVTISAVSDINNKTQNYVALFSDITPMKQHQEQLEHIAHYDNLTNLPNRMLLADRLLHALSQSDRRKQSVAVVYLDLDGFKTINDNYGHDAGDELLIKLSRLMSKSLREGDTLARIGGDEFVAVLADIGDIHDCKLVLNRLLQSAMHPISLGKRTVQISTSVGVTIYPQDDVDADQLIRHADQAMYIAKQTGKNRYHFFDVNQDKSIQNQHETIEHIKQGLERKEFVLYFQPKVNMRTGNVIGAEALIRWQHPERGLVPPLDFLPLIENNPVSVDIGDWVIETALDQMMKWQFEGLTIPVSVNVDAFHLQQVGFVEKLTAALALRPMLKPGLLELEILETSALGDMAEVLPIMKACIDIGVTFSLDDFGTGFSSLTYLRRLPIEILKIDQSFVRDMLEDPDDRAIVMGVIGLASAFNHKVIAEGVESIEHGKQLLEMGCFLAQGYGIARPMPAEDIAEWASQWKPDTTWIK